MTVLSTHRFHTYKAPASAYKRSISPKMTKPLQPKIKNTASIIPSKPPTRKIIVFGKEFEVAIPQDYDIYEGLRRWYPGLYNIVLKEDELIRATEEYEEEPLNEENYEEMWAYYDRLEEEYDA